MNHNESGTFNYKYDVSKRDDDDEVLKKEINITPPCI